MPIRPPLVRYAAFYLCSVCATAAFATLVLTALAWRPESNDSFWGVAMFIGLFATKFGLATMIPSALIGYVTWIALASRLQKRGELARSSTALASIASLWVGIVVMWLVTPPLLGSDIMNPLQAAFNPFNLILYPISAMVGWSMGAALLDSR